MGEATIKRGARFYVDDQGIIRGREADGASFGLSDAQELVVDISDLRTMTREARAYFTHKDHEEFLYAVALVVRSLVSRAIGNFFLGLNKPAVPTRLFTDDEDALAWLRTFIPKGERP